MADLSCLFVVVCPIFLPKNRHLPGSFCENSEEFRFFRPEVVSSVHEKHVSLDPTWW